MKPPGNQRITVAAQDTPHPSSPPEPRWHQRLDPCVGRLATSENDIDRLHRLIQTLVRR
jgi:hypothetical protein